jgi:hypothetical protein
MVCVCVRVCAGYSATGHMLLRESADLESRESGDLESCRLRRRLGQVEEVAEHGEGQESSDAVAAVAAVFYVLGPLVPAGAASPVANVCQQLVTHVSS